MQGVPEKDTPAVPIISLSSGHSKLTALFIALRLDPLNDAICKKKECVQSRSKREIKCVKPGPHINRRVNHVNKEARKGNDMKNWRGMKVSVVFMLLVSAVAVTGMGYGWWSQTLVISKTVNTGNVDLVYQGASTNDDATTTGGLIDSDDNDLMIQIFDFWATSSSADPSAFGPAGTSTATSTPRYDKDVALCEASIVSPDTATLDEYRVYPSYHCTAWFDIANNGTVPVKVESIRLLFATSTEVFIDPALGVTPVDLNGDELDDVEFDIENINLCFQIDPGQVIRMAVHQHLLMDAPQTDVLSYSVLVDMAQWNALGNIAVGGVCLPAGG